MPSSPKKPDGLTFETIFGPDIYKHRPGLLDTDLQFSIEGVGDATNGFDILGPNQPRLFAWVREGGGRAFRIHPLKPHLQETLDFLPDDWELQPDYHPAAMKAAAMIAAGYDLPADLEVLILENKEIWISKK
jgi:hypothetical protein